MGAARTPELAWVWTALETIKDPCLVAAGMDLSIVDLGLITRVERSDEGIRIGITFTDTGCQFTHRVMAAIYDELDRAAPGTKVEVNVEWQPVWKEQMANERGQAQLAAGRERFARRLAALPKEPAHSPEQNAGNH